MSSSAGCSSLALHTDNQKESSDDRPACLENPRPAGAESTLTENVASPFQAEPRHISSLCSHAWPEEAKASPLLVFGAISSSSFAGKRVLCLHYRPKNCPIHLRPPLPATPSLISYRLYPIFRRNSLR